MKYTPLTLEQIEEKVKEIEELNGGVPHLVAQDSRPVIPRTPAAPPGFFSLAGLIG